MRICILVRVLQPAGAQRFAIEEARCLSARGHHVDLVFLRRSRHHPAVYAPLLLGLSPTLFSKRETRWPWSPVLAMLTRIAAPERGEESTLDVDLLLSAALRIARGSYDIVLCHDPWAGVSGYLSNFLSGTPYVVFIHERVLSEGASSALQRGASRVEREVCRKTGAILCITEGVRESVRSMQLEIPTYVATAGTTLPMNRGSHDANEVLSVAMWDSGRRPEVYLELARNLERGTLTLAGAWRRPEEFEAFVRLRDQAGLQQKVTVTGPIREEDLQALYRRARVFVRFGFGESGIGSANMEAIGYGIPVITNRALGFSRLIVDGRHGFVLDRADGEEAARKADLLLDDRDLWARLSAAVTELSGRFTWESHTDILERALAEALHRGEERATA